MREVTENDFRLDEYKGAKIEDYEFRQDGQLVRKDRWEQGFRAIATQANLRSFEIHEVLLAVKRLVETRDAIKEIAQIAGVPSSCAEVVNWARSMAERARDTNASFAPSVGVHSNQMRLDFNLALGLLHDSLDAWLNEEDSVQKEHYELITKMTTFLNTASPVEDCSEPEAPNVAEAIRQIKLAVGRNSDMQKNCIQGRDCWHGHKIIDARLHDALAALGG